MKEPRVFDRMSALGDLARSRILVLLEQGDFTVSELVQVFHLPQSTVSRHPKVLGEDGWVTSRSSGTSRHYRLTGHLDDAARELCELVRPDVLAAGVADEDTERARAVLDGRRERSKEFFASSAHRWDSLRDDLFGADSEFLPLFGLLHSTWTVADLGAGTGHFSARIAPFVQRVITVDGSEEMLETARRRVDDVANVELRQGELERLPLCDGEVDLAVLLLALHYVVEPTAALREAARVLAPGGRLVIVDMRLHSREAFLEDMGHVWPGFDEATLAGSSQEAGLCDFTYQPIRARPDASGPLLFVASATKAD